MDAGTRVTIGVSCHTRAEVARAAQEGADFAVFGPVFEKERGRTRAQRVSKRCEKLARKKFPVLALGGITLENAEACIQAGAAGIAAIRLFQENEMGEVVSRATPVGMQTSVVSLQSSAKPKGLTTEDRRLTTASSS